MNHSYTLMLLLVVLTAAVCIALLWLGPRLKAHLAHRREFRRRALLEDALKHVFTQTQEGRPATLDSVAGHLELSGRQVLGLIMQLEAAGLLRTEGSQLRLTDEGEKWAVQVVRAHRLWETYLANEARMPMAKVHRPAEREEHRLTARRQIDELDAYLGHPRSDPHGDPIPTASGEMVPLEAQPLTSWPPGTPAEIAHLEDEPEPVMKRISGEGLRPGKVVEIVGQTSDQLTLSDGEREYRLPPVVAGSIQVVPVSVTPADRKRLTRMSELKAGEEAEVVFLDAELRGFTRRRLLDLGLTPKARVGTTLANAFGDPLAFRVRGTTVALRKDQASKIWVRKTRGGADRPAAG